MGLVAIVLVIGGMALALHIYNNWRLWEILNGKKLKTEIDLDIKGISGRNG